MTIPDASRGRQTRTAVTQNEHSAHKWLSTQTINIIPINLYRVTPLCIPFAEVRFSPLQPIILGYHLSCQHIINCL